MFSDTIRFLSISHYLFDDGRKATQCQAVVVFAGDDRTAQFDDQTTCIFQLTAIRKGFLSLFTQRSIAFVLVQLQMRFPGILLIWKWMTMDGAYNYLEGK